MKKFITTIGLALILTLNLVGCSDAEIAVASAMASASASTSISSSEETETINPELKKALDDYEVFINQYCDFLDAYLTADTNEQLAMMSDYTAIMSQYSDVADAIRALGECRDQMNSEELKYYLDVTNRCSTRMIECGNGEAANGTNG